MCKPFNIPIKKLPWINDLLEENISAVSIVLLSSVLIWSWWTIFYIPLNPDAGYCLSSAERIYEGWKPYRDFHVHYTPVGLYYFALFRKILGEGYVVYKIAFLVVELCSAALMFLLSGSVVKNRILRFAGTLLFLLLYLAYDGKHIVLEYFVVVFSLITILLLNINTKKWFFRSFFAGIFFLLTVMSKQYGVIIIPVLIILLFKDPEDFSLNFKLGAMRTAIFLIGFFSALFIMVSYLDIDFLSFITQVSGRDYYDKWGTAKGIANGRDYYDKWGIAKGIAKMVISLFSWRNVWFIFVLLLSFAITVRKFQFNSFIILLLCILSFGPLYVQTYPHYYQLILPYSVILLLSIVEYYFLSKPRLKRNWFETTCLFFLCISLLFTISFTLKETIYFSLNKETIQESLEISKRINKILPAGSPVLVINEPVFSYLCNFRPPTKENGYGFLYLENLKDFNFMKIENILWFDGFRIDYKNFLPKVEKTHKKISEFSISGNKKVEIWKLRSKKIPYT